MRGKTGGGGKPYVFFEEIFDFFWQGPEREIEPDFIDDPWTHRLAEVARSAPKSLGQA